MAYVISAAARILLDGIAAKEAPRGYDTVYGNHKMPKPLTSMTFNEVVADGPRRTREFGSSACGRFQFMRDTLDAPDTLADLKGELGLSGSELFSPELQDQMGLHLLKRRGFDKFVAGRISIKTFALNIAKEWASFPVLAGVQGAKHFVKRGQSFYAGDGLNKSLIKPEEVEALLSSVLMATHTGATEATAPVPPPRKPAATTTRTNGLAAVATALDVAGPDVIEAPDVVTQPSPLAIKPTTFLEKLAGRFIPKPIELRPGLAKDGDPALYDVQSALKALGYEPLTTDGLSGRMTRNAVYTAREQNGLPKSNNVDSAFLAALPGMKRMQVSSARATATIAQAQAQAPDLFAALKGFTGLGGVTTVTGVLGALADQGALDKFKATADKVNEVATTAGNAVDSVVGGVTWITAHWYLPVGVLGLVVIFRTYIGFLRLKVLYNQSRAT